MRAALYARYSTDMQSDRSAADQLAALRAAIKARGWTEVAAFCDEGISGQALATRPGVQALMRAAENGAFEVVIVEALDRLSRGQADIARLFELLTWQGVRLETLSSGPVSELHIGLEGTMNRLFLVELGKKTRRGLVGRVNAGFSGGGHCYGYDIAAKGVLAINPDQAEIVRRIFAAYAGGASTRAIAADLNDGGVPGPRGGTWSAGGMLGDRRAGDGILCQELYVGVRVFNRRRYRKHPVTGRRSGVLNPPTQWLRRSAPELRIVNDELWARVRARLAPPIEGQRAPTARRPKRLLSGLIHCGVCNGPMWLQGQKYACAAHRERGTCDNAKIIAAGKVEERVLEGVRARFLDPERISLFAREYHAALEAARAEAVRDRLPLERELAELARRFDRAADGYERGLFEAAELADRLTPIRARKAEIEAALASVDAPAPIRIHPNTGGYYALMIEALGAALEGDGDTEARDAIRSLIARVDLLPLPGIGQFSLTVHGKLARLLGMAEDSAAGCEVPVGAGTGFGRNLTALHVSFAA